ncbi:MAG TPA: FecR domain-containing protein [Prolixibacteraceae bacterium]|nr:FecR domain-containing protein [Prolixibacteraceae bacterium]
MENQNIPWGAISAKLKNVAGIEETKQIQEWLDLSSENQLILDEIVNVWSLTKGNSGYYQPDMSYNWKKLMEKINYQSQRKNSFAPYLRMVAAAAVLIMVFLAGITLSDQFTTRPEIITYSKIIAPKGSKTQVVLPDSSKVWLNSGAELWYPSDYTAENRQVWMKGECYFQVEKDPRHPLIVHGTKLSVKVYGTTFNLKEDEIRDITNVTLVSGNVRVLNPANDKISDLLPGQQLVYSEGKGEVKEAENLEALTSWVNNILIFKNQPFEEIISYLSGWYGVNIVFDHSLYDHHKYTFKVKTESLREVLELITIITPIDYVIEGDQITIKYKQKM